MQKLILALFFILFLISLGFTQPQNEQITITTYYPSPYGVYNELRLFPRNTFPTCNLDNEGGMFYNDIPEDADRNTLMVCTCPGGTCSWQTAVGGGGGGAIPEGATCKRTEQLYRGNLGGPSGTSGVEKICDDTFNPPPKNPDNTWYFAKTLAQKLWLHKHFPMCWSDGPCDEVEPVPGGAIVGGWVGWNTQWNCSNWKSLSGRGEYLEPVANLWLEADLPCSQPRHVWCCNF